MTTLLDLDLRAFFNDRPLVQRVVTTLQTDQGIGFVEALEQLHGAAEETGGSTLGATLAATRSEPEDIEQGVKLLERRDEAVQATFDQAAGVIMLEQTDQRGLVLLDQSAADGASRAGAPTASLDVGKALMDPATIENRLLRMRKADPMQAHVLWDGDPGREKFREYDRAHLENGVDMVRTAERTQELGAARMKAEQVGRQLDQAISAAGDKRQRVRLLDAEIAKLSSDRERLAAPAAEENRVRMLEAESTQSLYDRTQERNRQLDRGPGDFLKTLQEVVAGAPAPTVDEPATPPGVYPPSHELNKRVQARLLEQGDVLPNGSPKPGAYVRVLEQILAGR